MRLRQVALASYRLDERVEAFSEAFDLEVAYRDPHIHVYGLRNAVLPAGGGFIEIVEPVREDASAARFLNRRGGDAGYMVILQVADATAERDRIAALGVRVVENISMADYRAAHFHPADFGGVLVSVDQQLSAPDHLAPDADWTPAGPDWRAAKGEVALDLAGVVIEGPDPDALAARWSQLLARPLSGPDGRRLKLDRGEIRFALSVSGASTSISKILLSGDVEPATIGGVRFVPMEMESDQSIQS